MGSLKKESIDFTYTITIKSEGKTFYPLSSGILPRESHHLILGSVRLPNKIELYEDLYALNTLSNHSEPYSWGQDPLVISSDWEQTYLWSDATSEKLTISTRSILSLLEEMLMFRIYLTDIDRALNLVTRCTSSVFEDIQLHGNSYDDFKTTLISIDGFDITIIYHITDLDYELGLDKFNKRVRQNVKMHGIE